MTIFSNKHLVLKEDLLSQELWTNIYYSCERWMSFHVFFIYERGNPWSDVSFCIEIIVWSELSPFLLAFILDQSQLNHLYAIICMFLSLFLPSERPASITVLPWQWRSLKYTKNMEACERSARAIRFSNSNTGSIICLHTNYILRHYLLTL